MERKKTSEVFGMSNTVLNDSYIDRGELDESLSKLLTRRSHIAIKGPSKSGKSWLRQRVITSSIPVQCRLGQSVVDVYTSALADLGIKLITEESNKGHFKGRVEGQGTIGNDLIGKVAIKSGIETGNEVMQKTQFVGKDINDLKFIAGLIIESGKRLVIEDIHYLSTDQRESLAFDLKALWDYGCFVVVVGVWAESNMFIHLNPDLSGRVEEISVEWGIEDLRKILTQGSVALNIEISRDIQNKLINDSFGSAGLLQRLTLRMLDEANIHEYQDVKIEISNPAYFESAAMAVADQLNGVYQRLAERVASGIRSRNDSTGIYAHTMAVIVEADDATLIKGFHVDAIYELTSARQPRIIKPNLKSILSKIDGLQVDKDGRGLIVTYDGNDEKILNVDRQLLFYRKYLTVQWPWDELLREANALSSQ